MAMNGWGDPSPVRWLNLFAHPDATVDLVDASVRCVPAGAQGDERDRLWTGWRAYSKDPDDLDALAGLRSRPTAVVILEPAVRPGTGAADSGAAPERDRRGHRERRNTVEVTGRACVAGARPVSPTRPEHIPDRLSANRPRPLGASCGYYRPGTDR